MRVDARDVLDANARTSAAFRGRIVGYFRRVGPNKWDDYKLIADDQGAIEVRAGIRVQVEARGARFRMRRRGRVVVVEWLPVDEQATRAATPRQRRAAFIRDCMSRFDDGPALGAAAVIARKLRG